VRALIVTVLALTLAPLAAAAPPEPGEVDVIVAHAGAPRLRASGYADLEQRERMHGDEVFRIASLTKQFTAVGILAMVQDGALSLDDPLSERLPDCPTLWRAITIRQLLTHTSGITGDFGPIYAHARQDMTPRELISLYASTPLTAAPGAHWEYSNVNYWLLGLVIEALSGQNYSAFIDARVLAPAHLTDTRYGDWTTILPHRARGYERSDGRYQNARYFSASLGYSAGGYLSTARDMARWYAALGQGGIISREVLTLALTPTRLSDGQTAPYGLGWRLSTINGHLVAHHGGSSLGFVSYIYWRPDSGDFIGVFQNSSGDGEPEARARALFENLDR
jgi:CubicO group peptidase (beta-lactamase class C family)